MNAPLARLYSSEAHDPRSPSRSGPARRATGGAGGDAPSADGAGADGAGEDGAGEDERRREARQATGVAAQIDSAHGHRSPARLTDVSLHGCCLESEADWLRQGSIVTIGLEADGAGQERLPAVVRWMRGASAGLEFLRPVPADARAWQELMEFDPGR